MSATLSRNLRQGVEALGLNLDDAQQKQLLAYLALVLRSEERRVGKECRSRWSPYH